MFLQLGLQAFAGVVSLFLLISIVSFLRIFMVVWSLTPPPPLQKKNVNNLIFRVETSSFNNAKSSNHIAFCFEKRLIFEPLYSLQPRLWLNLQRLNLSKLRCYYILHLSLWMTSRVCIPVLKCSRTIYISFARLLIHNFRT